MYQISDHLLVLFADLRFEIHEYTIGKHFKGNADRLFNES